MIFSVFQTHMLYTLNQIVPTSLVGTETTRSPMSAL